MIYVAYEAVLDEEFKANESETFAGLPIEADGEPLVNPARLSSAERRSLLERIESREVIAVRAAIRMFVDRPNQKKSRPEPGRLGELAPLTAGTNFVRNHSDDVEDIGGLILASEVRTFERAPSLVGLHRISEPGEMAAFVRNERRMFSVALGAEKWTCSECDEKGWHSPWGVFRECDCEDAELFGRGKLRFLHNSSVSNPAVEGTGAIDLSSSEDRRALWTSARARGLHPLNAAPVEREGESGKEKNLSNFGASAPPDKGEKMPGEKTPEERIAEFEAREAQYKATIEEQEAREVEHKATIAKQEKVHLDAILAAKTASFCVTPAEHAMFHELREAGKLELALKMLEARQPMAATPTTPQGVEASLTGEEAPLNEEAMQWSACDAIVAQGHLPKVLLEKIKNGESIVSARVFKR